MEKDAMERVKALISKERDLEERLAKAGKLEVIKKITEDKYPDSIEIDLGGPGNRGKFYFNADDPEVSEMRLENYFKIAEKRNKLADDMKVKSSED